MGDVGRMHVGVFLGAFFKFEIHHAHPVVLEAHFVVVGIEFDGIVALAVGAERCE
jgi:hypothetical protein